MFVGVGLYVKNSAEAVEFYKEAFGLELGYHVKNPDGSYFHSELVKDGGAVLSVVEGDYPASQLVQLGIELESAADVRRAYDLLIDGGKIITEIGELPWSDCAALVMDKFGVTWFISSGSHRPADDWSLDDEKA